MLSSGTRATRHPMKSLRLAAKYGECTASLNGCRSGNGEKCCSVSVNGDKQTVNELSGLLGMDRNALQHHLETLETMGRVEHRSHNSYRIIDQEPNEKILARFKEGARCYA